MKPVDVGLGPVIAASKRRSNPYGNGIAEKIIALNRTIELIDKQSCSVRNESLKRLAEDKLRRLIDIL